MDGHVHGPECGCMSIPGSQEKVKVFGWKCDGCEDTHLAVYIKCDPPPRILEDNPEAEPFILSFQLTQEAATSLRKQLAYELANPAPGFEGGFQIAEFEF